MSPFEQSKDISKESQSVNQQQVDALLNELTILEVSHLGGDGILGSGEVETIVDQKYKELEKKETNTQEKITFIRDLISHIKETGVDNFSKIKNLKKDEFMNSRAIEQVQQLEKNYSNLLKKYPEYKTGIDTFIKQNFEHQKYVKDFYKKDLSNDKKQYEFVSTLFNEGNLIYVNSELAKIEEHIKEVQTSNVIKDKSEFFEYFMKNIKTGGWESKEGISKVEKIAQLGIYKDSFTMAYSGDKILPELLKIPYNKLEKMDSLYMASLKDPKKESALIEYVNKNLHEHKSTIFEEVIAYRNLFIKNEKNRLGIENFQGLTYVATDISKLDNDENKKVLEKVLVDITNFGRDNIGKANYIKNFISSNSNFIFGDTTRDSNLKFEILLDIFYHIKSSIVEGDNVDLTDIIEFEKNYEKRFEKEVNTFIQKNKGSEKARKVEILNKELNELDKDVSSEKRDTKRKEIYEIINSNSNGVQTPSPKIQEKVQDETGKEKLLKGTNGKDITALSKIQGITLTDKGELEIKKPVQIGQNGTIELGQNGELIFMSSLGYKFNFDKDLNKSANTFFEIKNQIDFFTNIGFGFFEGNFKDMITIIKKNFSLIGGNGIDVNEGEGGENNFFDTQETMKICEIFKKIGFLNGGVDINSTTNTKMTKATFTQKMEKLSQENGEDTFYSANSENFSGDGFLNTIKNKYQTSKKEA